MRLVAARLPWGTAHSGAIEPSLNGDAPETPRARGRQLLWPIGLVGGLFGGLLGIGGGSAIAPLLLLRGTLRPSHVSGTTLATVLVIAGVGAGVYGLLGHVDLDIAWPIALGSVVGSVIGALASRRLSGWLMTAVFLVILPYFAVTELVPSMAPAIPPSTALLVALGAGTGLLSGLIGISGASLVVPSLVDSAVGVATHAGRKSVDYRVLLSLAPPALAAALLGALLSNQLSEAVLRNLFAAFLVAVSLCLLVRVASSLLTTRVPDAEPRAAKRPAAPSGSDRTMRRPTGI